MRIRRFQCQKCGEVQGLLEEPHPDHCDRPMLLGPVLFADHRPDKAIQVRAIRRACLCGCVLADHAEGYGKCSSCKRCEGFRQALKGEHWLSQDEVWAVRPGRTDGGELVGWLGECRISWEYRMAPGIKDGHGVALERNAALAQMIVKLHAG